MSATRKFVLLFEALHDLPKEQLEALGKITVDTPEQAEVILHEGEDFGCWLEDRR